jgi:ubiquinone/menaquinone biosynthesis C-methylase UbiE
MRFLGDDGITLRDRNVADIGCGDGIIDLGVALKACPERLVGFDINVTDVANLAQQARRHGVAHELPRNLHFVQSGVTTVPVRDASFDVVMTWSAFEHVADPAALLSEIKRILTPVGILFLQLWPFYHSEHGGHLWEWFPGEGFVALQHSRKSIESTMRANPQGTLDWLEGRLRDFRDLNQITIDDLQSALLGAGFTISKVEVLTNAVHLPAGLDLRYPLSTLVIAGVKLLACPT